MAQLGIRKFDDLIGHTELVKRRDVDHWKANTISLDRLLYRPPESDASPTYFAGPQNQTVQNDMDQELIELSQEALIHKTPVYIDRKIHNADRAVGTMLSSVLARQHGASGLPDDTIQCDMHGSAGQSFGAFLAKGITMRLHGDANDYFGKGLSGGKLIVTPPEGSTFVPEENIIIGNTALYGATSGEAYVHGIAGERFCVRNSGALAVVEGVGDHCAEYMTGGRLLVLGTVGRNFAAGMSGGIAYVLNVGGSFAYFCNQEMVELTPTLELDDQKSIKQLLKNHHDYTGSRLAQEILGNWSQFLPRFVKVLPIEYKRVLQQTENELQIMRSDQLTLEEINYQVDVE
jgi:glutamate synthase (NADPH) large chain